MQPLQQTKAIPGENLGLGTSLGVYDSSLTTLIGDILRPNCEAVCKLATSHSTALRTMASELINEITVDLEARLLRVDRRNHNSSDSLDTWAMDIVSWTGHAIPAASADSPHNSDPILLKDGDIVECFEAFLLFVAHHAKSYFNNQIAAGLLKPEDCRLILPILCMDNEPESYDFYGVDHNYPNTSESGMFPLDSSVESHTTPAPLHVVAVVEMGESHEELFHEMKRLAVRTARVYSNQHNRRFVWGLTVAGSYIHAYVFGPDVLWTSNEINMASASGRQEFTSLLVDWSLCSVDWLGFDPSIRYAFDDNVGGPYLEIDIHEVDESATQVKNSTYYSKRCVGAVTNLVGCHARYFAASTSLESMDNPSVLIRDVWLPPESDPGGDKSSILDVLYAALEGTGDLKGRFSQIASAGSVYLFQGNTFVKDTTTTAFPGLAAASQHISGSQFRHHRRTVTEWAVNMISAADDPNKVIIAIADAMTAHNAAYAKCKILHGNISDRAIQFQETADGVSGVLGEFDYASFVGDSGTAKIELPDQMLFQSIRRLENAKAPCTRLDDWESLLYVICVLGAIGFSQKERDEFAADISGYRSVKSWNTHRARDASREKCTQMSKIYFASFIYSNVRQKQLRRLAMDIHKALFLHEGCTGELWCKNALDELTLRDTFENEVVAELLSVVGRHKQEALVELGTKGSISTVVAKGSADPSRKRNRNAVPTTTPMTTRSKAKRSAPEV
ncbi:hypothetical protein GGH94_002403 [Coemansia aciculifera]|uniref:Fungal-type protein kinase domain-containing protein n=1 Tax=Coemansia aciculifera TaxID=417176 RepID=A0A9W8M627_9FUNG|nr:hypothetical protein GGH94_002403 [Coemansia aciculifera]